MYIQGAMKIGLVAPVKPSHPYLENDPGPLFDLHHLRISPWLWFSHPWKRPKSKKRRGAGAAAATARNSLGIAVPNQAEENDDQRRQRGKKHQPAAYAGPWNRIDRQEDKYDHILR